MRSDCRPGRPADHVRVLLAFALVVLAAIAVPVAAAAQQHAPATSGAPASAQRAGDVQAAEGEHSEGVLPMIAKIVNFAALVGLLTYFLKTPLAGYLVSRASEIRQDLVAAADMRRGAEAQLVEIRTRLQALPSELEALQARGAEDLRAEQARLAEGITAERERLLAQTRREINTRLRIARRELIEYAAQLAVVVAEQRVRRAITPEDQLRLMDRYTTQLENAR